MVMDLIVLGIFLLVLIICKVRGFLLTLLSFFKGIASWIVAFIFCDDLSNFFIDKTQIGEKVSTAINEFLGEKIDSSSFLSIIPDFLKSENGMFSEEAIESGSIKIAEILITIASFLLIGLILSLVVGLLISMLKERDKDSKASKVDKSFGTILGIVLGLIYVYAFLALIIPVCSFVVPNQADKIMGLFDGSFVSRWMYDNNLLLMLIQKYF